MAWEVGFLLLGLLGVWNISEQSTSVTDCGQWVWHDHCLCSLITLSYKSSFIGITRDEFGLIFTIFNGDARCDRQITTTTKTIPLPNNEKS